MEQKVVLITGGSRGIGRVTAIALARQGHKVYATMRTPESCKSFGELENLFVERLDVTEEKNIHETVTKIIEKEERLDVVINNAGYGLLAPIELATEKEVYDQFNVNLFGVIRVIQAVLPQMRKQKSGQIINIGSVAGVVSNPMFGLYCASKHALEAISASVAATVYPWNIRVTVVQPAATKTEFCEVMPFGSQLEKDNPYKAFATRYGEHMRAMLKEGQPPEEIAELICEIIKMEHPDQRYQTSDHGKEIVETFLKDPSGNVWLENHKMNFMDWWETTEQ